MGKDAADILRPGVGAQIVVMGDKTQQRIPDAATHRIAGKALVFQGIYAALHIPGKQHH
jgi:hypothetical protein